MADGWSKIATVALVLLVGEGALALGAAGITALSGPTAAEMPVYCSASLGTGFTCTFTNPIKTRLEGNCVKCTLTPKAGRKGEAVESMALCSGSMGPKETKTVAVAGATNLRRACQDAQGSLDFDACDFAVVTLP